jgi:hypothetical protein
MWSCTGNKKVFFVIASLLCGIDLVMVYELCCIMVVTKSWSGSITKNRLFYGPEHESCVGYE